MDATSSLRIEGVSKSYLQRSTLIAVLDSISFNLETATWTTILGPSGCGKTTLLKIIAGLEFPDTGRVFVEARELSRLGETAYLPQDDTLLPWRTALGNAILASEIDGKPIADAKREALDLFDQFGLSGFESLYPSELSGGMRQRLALIRTFLTHRDILLLDEPLGALDPLTRATLQNWLLNVWSELKKTVLLVTHDAEEALLLSDRILVLTDRPAQLQLDQAVELDRPRDRGSSELVSHKSQLLRLLLEEEVGT
ncbi:ABC transporter ATP-binding protein [Candidatus Bipolaricaulota bacterium]|nr:ABC transporter ATP-binding protein [Candidatus Bipolaricaulota bacterium]